MDRALYTPSSSPPSSPSLCTIDSSPVNSPVSEPAIAHDSDGSPSFLSLGDPLAASVKANRTPPQYEKRYASSLAVQSISERPTKKHRMATRVSEEDVFRSTLACSLEHDRQASIWDEAITKVVDEGHGTMSLSSQNLTYISKRISELGNFVAIPARFEQVNASSTSSAPTASGGRLFTRTATAPASTTSEFFASRASGNLRTNSIKDVLVGSPREEIQLFLAGNQICNLPRELFCLQKMTVLIMRNNHLTHLPPEIVQLTNLRELNVSNNQLGYIPSEMLRMKLQNFCVHPNPFLQSPAPLSRSLSRSNSRISIASDQHRVVSPATHVQPRVTTLVEISCRILFSHRSFPNYDPFAEQNDTPTLPEETVLSRHELPLAREIWWQMPQPIRDTLELCVPGSVEAPESHVPVERVPTDGLTGISICPSPDHGKSVYIKHAEERYTWEETVAGVNVGGAVPVRWRGCQWGCLDFLNDVGQGEAGGGEERVSHSNEDVEMDMDDDQMGVVQLIEFTQEEYADFI